MWDDSRSGLFEHFAQFVVVCGRIRPASPTRFHLAFHNPQAALLYEYQSGRKAWLNDQLNRRLFRIQGDTTMIQQEKITSGYDFELLMGEEYLRYFLLTLLETSTISWWSEETVKDPDMGTYIRTDATVLHPPKVLAEKRLYDVHSDYADDIHPYVRARPEFVLPEIHAYSSVDDDFTVTLLPTLPGSPLSPDFRVTIYPTVIMFADRPGPAPRRIFWQIDDWPLYLDFRLLLDKTDLNNVLLHIKLVNCSGPLFDYQHPTPEEKEKALEKIKEEFDQTVPLWFTAGGQIANIDMKKFVSGIPGDPKAIGFYVNLVLKNGPRETDFLPADRGSTLSAQYWLPPDAHMAFGFPSETYTRLANNLFQSMAKLREGTEDEYHYPLEMDGKAKGKFKYVAVYHETTKETPTSPETFTNVLIVEVRGDIELDNWFDPDWRFRIRLVPIEKENGTLDFDFGFNLNLSWMKWLIGAVLEGISRLLVLGQLLPPFVASYFLIRGAEQYGAEWGASAVKSKFDPKAFVATFPHKLPVEIRRWDPLYTTKHCVEIALDELVINDAGFAFSAKDLFIGKQFEPSIDMVIRAVTRDQAGGPMTGLVYRAIDLGPYLRPSDPDNQPNDLKETFTCPAIDRMPFVELLAPEGDLEADRVVLTFEQIDNRMASEDNGAKDKHLEKIWYRPLKVDLADNQVHRILAISETEYEEIKARFPGTYEDEASRRATILLEPFEFAELQNKKLLILAPNKLELISMRRGDETTVYYRDKADHDPRNLSDNLLNLPRYES
jgi:hypothetical protein